MYVPIFLGELKRKRLLSLLRYELGEECHDEETPKNW